jgi:hypothetical protein
MKKKKIKNLQGIILVQMYEIMDSNAFSIKLFDFLLNFFQRCVDLGKTLRMKFISFHLDKV